MKDSLSKPNNTSFKKTQIYSVSNTLASESGGFRHSAQLGAKAAPLGTPVSGDSSKQSSVQHGQAGPDASKTSASASGGFRHSVQPGAEAATSQKLSAIGTSATCGPSSSSTDITDGQADAQTHRRVHRMGSLPEPYQRPSISILKKAKTESFMERPKSLRFSTEVEVKDISPCSPCTPSPLAEAVPSAVVGTPVDPSSIQWRPGSASGKTTRFGPTPEVPQPSPSASDSPVLSEMSPESPKGNLVQQGRLRSMSLLPDLPPPSHSPGPTQGSFQTTEAGQPQSFRVKVEHQGTAHERHNGGSKSQASQASHASAFLTWKEPNTCDPGHPSAAVHNSGTGNDGNDESSHNPLSIFAQYIYMMTHPSENPEPEQAQLHRSSQPLPLQADVPVLKTTVNCSNELIEMYMRHSGSHSSSRKSRKHRKRSAPPSPHRSQENIPTWQHHKVALSEEVGD